MKLFHMSGLVVNPPLPLFTKGGIKGDFVFICDPLQYIFTQASHELPKRIQNYCY